MTRWQRGEAEIEQMLSSGELQVLTGAAAGGEQWLSKARRTLGTVTGAAEICAAPKPRLGCTTTSSSATD
jgi:hypothetical protein